MKDNLVFSIVGIIVIGLIFSPVAFGASHMVDSPRKQMAMGVDAKDVICNSGLALMIKSSGSAACVKPATSEKLSKAGWGTIEKDVSMMDEARQMMMEEKEMMMEDDEMMEEKEMMMEDDEMMMSIGGIDISMAAPVEGSADAPITIIEFGDYQCPKCDQWFTQEKSQITELLLDEGIAKLYFLDFTFLGDDSVHAAEAAWCAGDQQMYHEYHSILYNNQGGINEGWASLEALKDFAVELDLDSEMFNACLDSGKYSERVSYNTEVGTSHGVEGTPAFFLVGPDGSTKRIDGPQPTSVFLSEINELDQGY